MKSILIPLIATLLSFPAFSQSENDSSVYQKGLALLEIADQPDKFLETAAYFERISAENSAHWLASYYAGLSYILAAKISSVGDADRLLDKAQEFVNKSFELNSEEPENHILQAFLYQVKLMADPQGRALSYSQKAEASLRKALNNDATNPRAYFLLANNVYYTPPFLKGGPKNALPVFIQAREKFRSFKPMLTFSPHWGEDQNEEMIRLCKNSKS